MEGIKGIVDRLTKDASALHALVQKPQFVGFVLSQPGYDRVMVLTNDFEKVQVKGIPRNCFLVATNFDPEAPGQDPKQHEVVLLRAVGAAKLPMDDQNLVTKYDFFTNRTSPTERGNDLDDLTKNQVQFGAIECRVLGTLYLDPLGKLRMGSDIENFETAGRLLVYKPIEKALHEIVNFIDPDRKDRSDEEARRMGFKSSLKPFPFGRIRYTSTERLQRESGIDTVRVALQPADLLARRTAVLGMTRTGKSNMIKQLVKVVKRIATEGDAKVGQIIFDLNGEYANANKQDQTAISEIFKGDTVRYRTITTDGFLDLRLNFYEQVLEGLTFTCDTLAEHAKSRSDYLNQFMSISLDQPDPADVGETNRWQVRVAAYCAMLHEAQFPAPAGFKVRFAANKNVVQEVNRIAGEDLGDPKSGFTLDEAATWFKHARTAHRELKATNNIGLPSSSKGKAWVDGDLEVLFNMIACKGANDTFISGHKLLVPLREYHTASRRTDVAQEVYDYLAQGKIVILDLSVGEERLRESLSKLIVQKIFTASKARFIRDQIPPNIVVYVEEAHNLIGKDDDLEEIWPRIAKEGAKYRIGLVYATQEPSTVHQSLLSATENFFITHLNNENEIKAISKYYDFGDFADSLLRAQDVGFARVKTLSATFVSPVQIDKFTAD